MRKKLVKEIMRVVNFKIQEWQNFIVEYSGGESISTSTISNWRQGKQEMGSSYIDIFIKVLCEKSETAIYKAAIRNRVMECLNIRQYQKQYWDLKRLEYKEFLEHVLKELEPDNIWNLEYSWDKISIPILVDICTRKIREAAPDIECQMRENRRGVELRYSNSKKGKHTVLVNFLLGETKEIELEQECSDIATLNEESLVRYLFVTCDVSDKVYVQMLKKYRMFLLKIDFYDVDSIKVMKAYVLENSYGIDDETLKFMNILADIVVLKIFEMNLIVLKEILCKKFDLRKINKDFLSSNAGIWQYQYPIRRALAFEEKLIKQKMKLSVKKERNKSKEEEKKTFKILDLNLTGGLLGLRCSLGVDNVTCADVSTGELLIKKYLVDLYNDTEQVDKGYILNVNYAYLRMDTMKLIGDDIPEDGYDLIILGLGSGSYMPNLDGFLRQLGSWLKKGEKDKTEEGALLLSVYNKDALCFSATHAKMDFKYEHGVFRHVCLEGALPAKLYSYKEICHMTMKYYELIEGYSYPTVMSIVSEYYDEEILEKLKEVDKNYAYGNSGVENKGLFNVLYLKKIRQEEVQQCYLDTQAHIRESEIVLQIIQHEEITSRATMLRELNRNNILVGDNFIKTVVIYDEENDIICFYLLPLNKKFNKENLTQWYRDSGYEMKKNKIRLCKESELRNMGLTSGSVSPFSFRQINVDIDKQLLCDMEIEESGFQTFYTYSGDLKITYKVGKKEFVGYLLKNDVVFI